MVPAPLSKARGERRWSVTVNLIAPIVLQILIRPHQTQPLPNGDVMALARWAKLTMLVQSAV